MLLKELKSLRNPEIPTPNLTLCFLEYRVDPGRDRPPDLHTICLMRATGSPGFASFGSEIRSTCHYNFPITNLVA